MLTGACARSAPSASADVTQMVLLETKCFCTCAFYAIYICIIKRDTCSLFKFFADAKTYF